MQVIVKLTTKCNLNCVYCSEGDKAIAVLEKKTLFKAIDELPNLLEKYKRENISLLWHGGEPLSVGKTYLQEVMQYAVNKLKNYKLKFLVQTNGTLIDAEWIDLFKKFNVGVGVSLDGYKELHDRNRLTKSGKSTFDLVIANVQKLRQAGINCGTLMVLNTANKINVVELAKCIEEYDLQPKIHPVIACGRAVDTDVIPIYANYVELMKELYKYCMSTDRDIVIEPLNEIMDAILGLNKMKECSFNGSCGRDFLCLYPDGSISFCGRADNSQLDLSYGNLNNKSLLELFESSNAQKIRSRQRYLQEHDCCGCSYWEFCHGGCAFEAVTSMGVLYSKYTNCKMRQQLLDFLKTEGLQLLKEKLIKQKKRYKLLIGEKEKMIGSINNAEK